MNAFTSLLGILIASVAVWGTATNPSSPSAGRASAHSPAEGIARAEVSGRVVDRAGEPVAGVMVVVRPSTELAPAHRAGHPAPVL